jgi:mono/diheme cytochrome c family protein
MTQFNRITAVAALTLFGAGYLAAATLSQDSPRKAQIERGKYLVNAGLCTDCHTPGNLRGDPDMKRFLGGSDVGFEVPGLGVFHGRNLTPDKETGLGNWSEEQIVTAFTTGIRPDGRQLAPIMPYQAFSKLTKDDAYAIAVYLKTLTPIKNKVPGPFGPTEKQTTLVMRVVPPPAQTAQAK